MMETETSAAQTIAIIETESIRRGRKRMPGLIVAILCLVLSVLAAAPFFFMGEPRPANGFRLQMPVTHDMHLHYWQMRSFFDGLASGEIYPRWEEDTNRGFGAPTTSYYPPVIYYLTSAFYWIAGDWMWSLLSSHLLMMLASGAAIYLYARRFMDRLAATVAMAAYIFLPYHLLDQYQRGALAELLGFIWMPLMLLYGERLFKEGPGSSHRPNWPASLAGLAASTAAFLWSHPPTAYQFLLAFALFVAMLAWLRRDLKGLIMSGVAAAFGLALSAAYLYPAFVEQDLISHDYVSDTWPYHGSYVFVHRLPYADSHRGFFNLIDAIWVYCAVMIALGAIFLLARRRARIEPRLRESVMLWVLIGGFASFMMTSVSYPLGSLIPKIDIGVFTWRMLSITTLVVAMLAGACAQAARAAFSEGRRAELAWMMSLAGMMTVGGMLFSVTAVWGPMYRAMRFVPVPEHINYAMLPREAPRDPLELPLVGEAELEAGRGRVEIKRWDPEHREMEVILDGPDRLLVRTFNFPGWTATVDGGRVPMGSGQALRVELSDSSQSLIREATFDGGTPVVYGRAGRIIGKEPLGDITLDLGPGAYNIKLDYLDTHARLAGKLVSGISFLAMLTILIVWRVRRVRRV